MINLIFSRFVEYLRGHRTIIEITEKRSQIESLIAYAVLDYTLTIHCKERKFESQYERWFIPNKVVRTYEVFTTVAGKPPPLLVQACTKERTFPSLLFKGNSSKNQKEAAIEAFIDLIKAHLETANDPMRFN